MVSSLDTNPREFWKTIGRTVVADNRNQNFYSKSIRRKAPLLQIQIHYKVEAGF